VVEVGAGAPARRALAGRRKKGRQGGGGGLRASEGLQLQRAPARRWRRSDAWRNEREVERSPIRVRWRNDGAALGDLIRILVKEGRVRWHVG
jgi:hypothetical protein